MGLVGLGRVSGVRVNRVSIRARVRVRVRFMVLVKKKCSGGEYPKKISDIRLTTMFNSIPH